MTLGGLVGGDGSVVGRTPLSTWRTATKRLAPATRAAGRPSNSPWQVRVWTTSGASRQPVILSTLGSSWWVFAPIFRLSGGGRRHFRADGPGLSVLGIVASPSVAITLHACASARILLAGPQLPRRNTWIAARRSGSTGLLLGDRLWFHHKAGALRCCLVGRSLAFTILPKPLAGLYCRSSETVPGEFDGASTPGVSLEMTNAPGLGHSPTPLNGRPPLFEWCRFCGLAGPR